jgi:hypothetical protein
MYRWQYPGNYRPISLWIIILSGLQWYWLIVDEGQFIYATGFFQLCLESNSSKVDFSKVLDSVIGWFNRNNENKGVQWQIVLGERFPSYSNAQAFVLSIPINKVKRDSVVRRRFCNLAPRKVCRERHGLEIQRDQWPLERKEKSMALADS